MKMALIEVGEVLIPIIVPIVEKLASFVKAAAQAFDGLPGPLKTVTIAFVALAAAAGPVMFMFGGAARATGGAIKAFGSMASVIGGAGGKGLLGRLGKFKMLLKPGPMMAFGAAAGAAGVIIGRFRKRAKEARDRMKMLHEEFLAAGDPASTLKDRVHELATELKMVEQATDDATEATSKFVGEQVLTKELIGKDVTEAFGKANFDMEKLTNTLSGGSDEFERLSKQAKNNFHSNEKWIESMKNADIEVRDITTHLAELVEVDLRQSAGRFLIKYLHV